MSEYYNHYGQLSEIYDPYTSAPSFNYLFNSPGGIGPNFPSTSKKDIIGEITDPGTTTAYETLPPPPKRFATMGAESFSPGSVTNDSGGINSIILIVLVVLVFLLLLRTNKMIKEVKKMRKRAADTNYTGSGQRKDHLDSDSDDYVMY